MYNGQKEGDTCPHCNGSGKYERKPLKLTAEDLMPFDDGTWMEHYNDLKN